MNGNLQFTVVPLSPTLTLLEERVGVESVSCTGTCVKEAISCSHVQPHILFLITGSTILIYSFLYSISYRSSSFERNFLRLISYFFKNLRLNFLQSCFLCEWAGTVFHEHNRLFELYLTPKKRSIIGCRNTEKYYAGAESPLNATPKKNRKKKLNGYRGPRGFTTTDLVYMKWRGEGSSNALASGALPFPPCIPLYTRQLSHKMVLDSTTHNKQRCFALLLEYFFLFLAHKRSYSQKWLATTTTTQQCETYNCVLFHMEGYCNIYQVLYKRCQYSADIYCISHYHYCTTQ